MSTSAPAPPAADPSRNPFRAAGFTRWWLASLLAGTGVGIQTVTVPLFIRDRVDLDARAIAIAAALVAQTLPGALLALVGGAVADRVERRRILVRTYTAATVVSLFYVWLAGADVRVIWPVFPLAAALGAASAFSNPTRQSMLPQLVSRAQLQNGVILGTMGFMATLQFLGPTAGGFLVDLSGLTWAFGAEAGLLALAALVFAGVATEVPVASGRSVLEDLRAGLRYIGGEPRLRDLLLLGTIIGVFFIGPFAVTVPIVVPDVYGVSDKWVGILWGCFGAGVFAGSVVLTFRPLPRRGLCVCLSVLNGGATVLVYGMSGNLWLSAMLLVWWGLGASVFMNYVVALLQEHTAPPMMGRVMSMYTLAFFASMPLGYAQAGIVTSLFSPQVTLIASGVVSASIGLACLILLPHVRALE